MLRALIRCWMGTIVVFATVVLGPHIAIASGSISSAYFVLPENHPDVNHGIDGSTIKGLVAGRLGSHGFPVATSFARMKGGPKSGPIHDINANGEIMWWSVASTHHVRAEAIGTATLPLLITSMFPLGHVNDTHGFRTAHFRGTFMAGSGQTAGMQLGSDDDAWVFVDGVLHVDNGGVKAMTYTPYSLGHLGPGKHVLDIFYADRFGSGAAIQIDSRLALAPAPLPTARRRTAPASLTVVQMRAQLQKTGRFTLRDIHFAFNKTEIARDSAAVLSHVGELLRTDPSLRLRVEGHTDNVGSAAYNADLSKRRADAVKAYLIAHNTIGADRLRTVGFGLSRPVASNATPSGQAMNRRVEFVKI